MPNVAPPAHSRQPSADQWGLYGGRIYWPLFFTCTQPWKALSALVLARPSSPSQDRIHHTRARCSSARRYQVGRPAPLAALGRMPILPYSGQTQRGCWNLKQREQILSCSSCRATCKYHPRLSKSTACLGNDIAIIASTYNYVLDEVELVKASPNHIALASSQAFSIGNTPRSKLSIFSLLCQATFRDITRESQKKSPNKKPLSRLIQGGRMAHIGRYL